MQNTAYVAGLERSILSAPQAATEGFQPLAGPYTPNEAWMLENAVMDLVNGRRDFALVREDNGKADSVSIFTRGQVTVKDPWCGGVAYNEEGGVRTFEAGKRWPQEVQ